LNPGSRHRKLAPTPGTLTLLVKAYFTISFFSCDKMAIDMNMLMLFLAKFVWTATKTMFVDQKKTYAIFGVATSAKCCELKRCANRVCRRTDNKGEVLEGKFCNLNF